MLMTNQDIRREALRLYEKGKLDKAIGVLTSYVKVGGYGSPELEATQRRVRFNLRSMLVSGMTTPSELFLGGLKNDEYK